MKQRAPLQISETPRTNNEHDGLIVVDNVYVKQQARRGQQDVFERAKKAWPLTEEHVPRVLRVPSLALDGDIQSCALEQARRFTDEDIRQRLTLRTRLPSV